MKTVFLCVNYPIFEKSIGISKKIKTQIETFEKLGYRATYSAYMENGVAIISQNKFIIRREYSCSLGNEIFRRFRLMSLCNEYLEGKKFDLGFVRWDAADYQYLSVLKHMDKCCDKVLMDFHGYFPKYNTPGIKGKYTLFWTKKNGDQFSRYVDLGLTETKNLQLFGVKTLPIDTGIDVTKYSIHNYRGDADTINLISVANETAYHGYDRIIKGLYEYIKTGGNKKVYLHLVGKMSKKTKKLVNDLSLNTNIFLYGYKNGKELEEIYNKCNIGVGPLAPHRTGGKEGTGIKTKEYFAIGLPYIYAGNELLVPETFPYVFKVPSNDEPIKINDIIAFYNSIKNNKLIQENMRFFALENFSYEKMFRKALNIIKAD